MTTFLHDPNATLDYRANFGPGDNGEPPWLAEGETITSRTITVTGATKVSDSITDAGQSVTAWVSGGELGTIATVVYHVTTNQGRTDDRTLYLRVVDR